jgi:hypothetical protein
MYFACLEFKNTIPHRTFQPVQIAPRAANRMALDSRTTASTIMMQPDYDHDRAACLF